MLTNLLWLVRPVISRKAPKQEEEKGGDAKVGNVQHGDSDFEMIDEKSELEGQPEQKKLKLDNKDCRSDFSIKHGVAQGYWKDLLDILFFAVNELRVDGDVRSVLNVQREKDKKYKRNWTEDKKKQQTKERYNRAVKKLDEDGF